VTLWHTLRHEVVGAWRSVRYDVRPPGDGDRHEPDDHAYLDAEIDVRALSGNETGRRLVTASGVVLLVAGGAAGTYLAVAGGLGSLMTDTGDNGLSPYAAPVPPAISMRTPAARGPLAVAQPPLWQRHEPRRPVPAPAPTPVGVPEPQLPPEPPTSQAGDPIPESTTLPSATTSPTPSESPPASISPAAS
jgi:hypothetical protein